MDKRTALVILVTLLPSVNAGADELAGGRLFFSAQERHRMDGGLQVFSGPENKPNRGPSPSSPAIRIKYRGYIAGRDRTRNFWSVSRGDQSRVVTDSDSRRQTASAVIDKGARAVGRDFYFKEGWIHESPKLRISKTR